MTFGQAEPLEAVIARFRGPSQPRHGDRSDRLWWSCPFHEDPNPSFCVRPGEARYRCFGCGAKGDAIDFVRRLDPSLSFKEAVAAVGGELVPARAARPPKPVPRRQPPPRPDGWQAFARGVVERAEALLWSPRGSLARGYLRGRGLSEATVRAARLGLQADDAYVGGVFPDAKVFVPRGIVIPWFEGPDLALVNVRRPVDEPKYWALKRSRKGGIYPSRGAILAGRPLVIAEGELDALLLGQELAGLAPVVTLGSAGDRPRPAALSAMLGARPWLVAPDSDEAGDASAGHWLAHYDRCRRVRPPAGKDWTESREAGIDLRAWWAEALPGSSVGDGPGGPDGPPSDPAWLPPPWWVLAFWDHVQYRLEALEERAAIMEFDGGSDRSEAERRAFVEASGWAISIADA